MTLIYYDLSQPHTITMVDIHKLLLFAIYDNNFYTDDC